MKKIILYSLMISGIAFLLSSCAQTKNLTGRYKIAHKWNVISVDSVSNQKVALSKAYIDLSKIERGGAKAGCNSMFFTFVILKDNKIKFSEVGSTMMACADMEVEGKLGKLIPLVNNYEVKDSVLSLKIDDKIVITAQ